MRFRFVVTCICVLAAVMLPVSHVSAQDLCFNPAVNYAAGRDASSVFAADLDGDNDADLAVANVAIDSVSVVKNSGDGTFAAAVYYVAGNGPISVFAADLDGDNDADLAVANAFSANVSVLKNNGDGTFAAAVNYAAGNGPRSVFAADLDGDNDADLAVANANSDNVSVLKNNGDGTFAAAVNYAAGDYAYSVFAADLDGDDDADLAVANETSGNVSVLKNNGDGTFEAPVNYAAGTHPLSVFVTDLDGDNDADLAVANNNSANVSVLKNNGDGTFAAATNYATGDGPYSVFAANLDGDNDADLAVANYYSDNVSVLKNNGDGTFAARVNYAVGLYPSSVFAADLDGDNDADLAVANSGSNNVSVLKNCLLPIIVSSLSDAGAGSLRSAIATADVHEGTDTITFAVAGTIHLASPLPPLADTSNPIVILGFTAPGAVAPYQPTVVLDGSLSTPGTGLRIFTNSNFVEGLTIRNFQGPGIDVVSGGFNTITKNRICGNAGIGIDLLEYGGIPGITLNDPGDTDMGANFLANYPVIDTIHLVTGDTVFYVAGTASFYAIVELSLAERYLGADTTADGSGHGEAWLYLGSDTADGITGHWAFPAVHSRGWSWVTATATDSAGNTSEYSENRRLIPDSLIYTTYSPVHMIVTSPDKKDSIGPGFNTFGSPASYDDTHDYGPGPDGIPGTLDDRITITNIQPGEYTCKIIPDPGGSGNYFFGIRVDGTEARWGRISGFGDTTHTEFQPTAYSNPVPSPGEMAVVGFTPTPQRRGDLNSDGVYNVQDVVLEVNVAFRGADFPNPVLLADINCDGLVCNVQDVVKLVDVAFRGGAEPCP